jgi:hypothetical protein
MSSPDTSCDAISWGCHPETDIVMKMDKDVIHRVMMRYEFMGMSSRDSGGDPNG